MSRLRHGLLAFASLLCLSLGSGCPLPQVGLDPDAVPPTAEHWIRFAHISDIHITDEESPARALRFDGLIASSWRPQEAYAVAIFDATLQAINRRHSDGAAVGRPVDFVLMTGDLTDLGQYNEFQWFLQTVDGEWVQPDSGIPDGAFRPIDPTLNPKLPYRASGLNPDIPWYAVIGNHDLLATGNFPIRRTAADPLLWDAPLLKPVAIAFGLWRLTPRRNALLPTDNQSPAIILGSQDVADPVTMTLSLNDLRAGPIVPDPDRHFMSRAMIINALFATKTQPPGHGFSPENLERDVGRYTFRPIPEVPLRFIVMDTVAPDPYYGLPLSFGVLTREQFESFVKPSVEEAKKNGEFVILVSHHPIRDFILPYPGSVKPYEIRAYLTKQPHIIAQIAGHSHVNRIQQVPGKYPYIELETGSIIDMPQAGRLLDVYWDSTDKAIFLASTMFDHRETPTPLSQEGARRAALDPGTSRKTLSPEAAKLRRELEPFVPKEWLDAWLETPAANNEEDKAYPQNLWIKLPKPDFVPGLGEVQQ